MHWLVCKQPEGQGTGPDLLPAQASVENTIRADIKGNRGDASPSQPQPRPKADGYGPKGSGDLSS